MARSRASCRAIPASRSCPFSARLLITVVLVVVRAPTAPLATGAAGPDRGPADRLRAERDAGRRRRRRSLHVAGSLDHLLLRPSRSHLDRRVCRRGPRDHAVAAAGREQLPRPLGRRDGLRLGRRRGRPDARASQRHAADATRRRSAHRRPHRPAQPTRLRRARFARARARAARRRLARRRSRSTSTTSSASTTSGVTRSATACSSG